MGRRFLLLLMLVLGACKPAEEGRRRAIVGAVLIDGGGGPPVSDSVVVVAGGQIAAVGARLNVPIAADTDLVNGAGKYLVPAPIDLSGSAGAGLTHVAATASAAVIEAARNGGKRVAAEISTAAGMRAMVDNGAAVLVGMVRDTTELDAALLGRMRNLRIVVAPALSRAGAQLETASRNTLAMFRAGVPIALASGGGDAVREAELLAAAGLPPFDVIAAATQNSAMALGELDQTGTIAPGKRADLLLLSANPGEDVANLRRVALRMSAGEWVR